MFNFKKRWILFFILSSLLKHSAACSQPIYSIDSLQIQHLSKWAYHQGDDDWGLKPLVDSSTVSIRSYHFKPAPNQIHWYRMSIQILSPLDHQRVFLQFEGVHSAFEIFWDGKKIGQNGQVGNKKEDEIPGKFIYKIRMQKDWIEPGLHTLAIRFSNHHSHIGKMNMFRARLVDDDLWGAHQTRILFIVYLEIGIFLCATLFALALFLGGGRHRSYLILAIYCIVDVIIISYFFVLTCHLKVPITWINSIVYTQYLLTSVNDILLCLFFILNFNIQKIKTHFTLMFLIVFVITLSGLKNAFSFDLVEIMTRLYIFGLILQAIRKKIPGSIPALLGIFALTLPIFTQIWGSQVSYYFYFDFYSVVYTLFIFCIILAISRQILEQNRIHHETVVRSHRLEAELLKKNIQPHFIMNTLLSIVSWIGEDPKKAIQLIQALAEEFRIINKISAEREITLSQEIHLCHLHLKLMGFRKDATYKLSLDGINEDETVPPMIFHTLIENGLTHAYESGESGQFTLTYNYTSPQHHYSLKNDGSRLTQLIQKDQDQLEEGMGMKYVKSRLEERYGSSWKMTYGILGKEWVVDIYFVK